MWLAETAVDVETLELLAAQDIQFVILAPHQAARVRAHRRTPMASDRRRRHRSQPSLPPSCCPPGASIALFFYDGPIARAVAFEGLLSHGDRFVDKLMGGFADDRDWPQLVHIATDGESYGHHHRFGDMALAYALDRIETQTAGALDQLRRVSRKTSAHPRSRDRRKNFLELRPRHRPLVERLRLQLRRPSATGTNSGARRCATRSTGCAIRSHRCGSSKPRIISKISGLPGILTSK